MFLHIFAILGNAPARWSSRSHSRFYPNPTSNSKQTLSILFPKHSSSSSTRLHLACHHIDPGYHCCLIGQLIQCANGSTHSVDLAAIKSNKLKHSIHLLKILQWLPITLTLNSKELHALHLAYWFNHVSRCFLIHKAPGMLSPVSFLFLRLTKAFAHALPAA